MKRGQKGGAAYDFISNPDRVTIWKDLLPADLQFVFNQGFASGAAAAAAPPESVSRYITIVERQDELFGLAVKAIAKSINVDLSNQEDIIAKTTTTPDLYAFLDDIGNLIYFNAPPETGQNKTKLQQIKREALIDLLLYPASAQNRFMHEVAEVCISMKADPSILTDIQSNDDLKQIRAKRYQSLAQANAYLMTGHKLRDGFFASQFIRDFETAMATNRTAKDTGFWNQFVFGCFNFDIEPITDRRSLPYGLLAAFVFQKYRDNTDPAALKSEILTAISRKSESSTFTEAGTNDAYRPDWSELTKEVVPGLTMLKVLQNISLEQLQFIVHLIYLIQQKEPASSPESAAPEAETAP